MSNSAKDGWVLLYMLKIDTRDDSGDALHTVKKIGIKYLFFKVEAISQLSYSLRFRAPLYDWFLLDVFILMEFLVPQHFS